jgi:hypothetical protein
MRIKQKNESIYILKGIKGIMGNELDLTDDEIGKIITSLYFVDVKCASDEDKGEIGRNWPIRKKLLNYLYRDKARDKKPAGVEPPNKYRTALEVYKEYEKWKECSMTPIATFEQWCIINE